MNDIRDWLTAAVVHDAAVNELGAKWPKTYREYTRAFAVFGCRVRYLPRWVISRPLLRNRTLYLPIPKNEAQLKAWLCHELAHAVMDFEGIPPLVYPAAWGDHERWASLIEQIIVCRRAPHPERWSCPLPSARHL